MALGNMRDSDWRESLASGRLSKRGPLPTLDDILDQWRALERERDSLAESDPRRAAIDEVIGRLRELYHSETRRRQQDGHNRD